MREEALAHDRRSYGVIMPDRMIFTTWEQPPPINEDKLGAALLRAVIVRAHVVCVVEDGVELRVVLPLNMMDWLETWGAASEDDEGEAA